MNILYAGVSTALLRERLRRFCRPAFRWRGRRQRAAGKRCWNPPQVRGDPGDKESEVAGGTVEITRGRGRDCQFCSPDLLAFRSIADSLICFTDRSRARGWECYQNVLAKNSSFEVISLHGPTGPPKLKKCSKNGPNHLNRFVFAKAYSIPLSCWIVFETLKILW